MWGKEQVERAVRYIKYPSKRWPNGMRGAGTVFAPPVFNQDDGAYLVSANENTMLIAQIETRLGVENCESIAAVDGVGRSQGRHGCLGIGISDATQKIAQTQQTDEADALALEMLFVGPNDLASSMGYFAFDHASFPEVQAAATRVRDAASVQGKFSGHFCGSGELGAYTSQ